MRTVWKDLGWLKGLMRWAVLTAGVVTATKFGQGPFSGLDNKWHSRVCIQLGKLFPPCRVESFLLLTGNRSWPIHACAFLEIISGRQHKPKPSMGVLYQLRCERSLACLIHCPESPRRRLHCLNNAYWNSPKVKCQSFSLCAERWWASEDKCRKQIQLKKKIFFLFLFCFVSLCFSEQFPWFNDITL